MIIDIPGYKKLQITTLLLDYNGTIAEDGVIRPAVSKREVTETFQGAFHLCIDSGYSRNSKSTV